MNKIIPVIILCIILLGVGSYVAYSHYLDPTLHQNSSIVAGQKTSSRPMFHSIKDAMNKSISLTCEYTDSTQKITKVYIKGGIVRADTQNSGNAQEVDSVIMKNNKLYVWSNRQNQGTVIDFSINQNSTISGMMNQQSSDSSEMKGENFMKDLETQKEHCKPSIIADSLFTVPSEITFIDLGNMVKMNSTGAPINYQQYMQAQQSK